MKISFIKNIYLTVYLETRLLKRLSTEEMKSAYLVYILDEAEFSQHKYPWEWHEPISFLFSYGEIYASFMVLTIGQTLLFSLGLATCQGEGKPCIRIRLPHLKIHLVSHLVRGCGFNWYILEFRYCLQIITINQLRAFNCLQKEETNPRISII